MSAVHHRFATIEGRRIFYREAGSPESPTVVLLHGYPTSSAMYRNLIPLLADRYHVAAPAVSADDPRVYWPDGTVEPATDAMVRLSAPANLTGLPAVSVPCGFSASGLPLGMQIIGGPFEESTILTVARTYELATDHVGRIAEMSVAAS